MSNIDIIRAWKDEEYRNSLSEEQRSLLPENPAGLIELSDEMAQAVAGGCIENSTNGALCPGGKFSNGVTCCVTRKIVARR